MDEASPFEASVIPDRHLRRWDRWISVLFALVAMASGLNADEAIAPFEDVQAVLVSKCVACHGPDEQEGGLRLDSREDSIKGGDRGPAIVPGEVEASLLVRAIRFDDLDLQMPPKQKLSQTEIALLTSWVKSGASWPEIVPGTATKDSSSFGPAVSDLENPIRKLFLGERLDLWSLKPLEREGTDGPSDRTISIDASIEESLANAKLRMSPPADARMLIRRVTFDLTGLPPTPEDVAAFVKNPSDAAYEQLVDRLLNSPQYGERQARLELLPNVVFSENLSGDDFGMSCRGFGGR